MNNFKIVMPKINSGSFYITKHGNSGETIEYPAKELKDFIKNKKFEQLSYGTKEGMAGFSNFKMLYKNNVRPKIEATEQRLVESKNDFLLASVTRLKKQVVEEFASYTKKITTVSKHNQKGKSVYKTEEILTKDNFYKVIRTKNGEFISGYECYLDDISKTAKKYTKRMFKNLTTK